MSDLPYGETPTDATTLIREVRKAKRMTLEAIAEKVGVTRQTVQRWELDGRKISVKRLHDVAAALGVQTRQLLPGDDGLSVQERRHLQWMRDATPAEVKHIQGLMHSLSEARAESFETRKDKTG